MLYAIIALLLLGIVLIILELILIPGTTVVGFVGFLVTIGGIIFCYREYGSVVGFWVLISTSTFMLATLFFSFRFNAWSRFSLKSSIKSKVNEGLMTRVNIGDNGIAISTLKPVGKAQFNDQQLEVKTTGGYVNEGVRIKIIRILSNQIIVEPLN